VTTSTTSEVASNKGSLKSVNVKPKGPKAAKGLKKEGGMREKIESPQANDSKTLSFEERIRLRMLEEDKVPVQDSLYGESRSFGKGMNES